MTERRYRLLHRCLAALALGAPVLVHAAPALVGGLYASDNNGNLVRVNPATGAGTPVCLLPNAGSEIEYDNVTGRFYQAQPVGDFTIREFDINTCAPLSPLVAVSHTFAGLEFVGATLYGVGFDSPQGASTLYTINPQTGAVVTVGPTGRGPISGLAYDAANAVMYGIQGNSNAALYRVNLATGATTVVGNTNIRAGSLEFGADGLLYAGSQGGPNTAAGFLWRIDPATAVATPIGSPGIGVLSGLAQVQGPAAILPVPAARWPAWLALLGLLAVVAARALRGIRDHS
jgi:hypothetical protein